MLQIVIPERELWNEEKQEFVYTSSQTLQLEHSLVSLSKWECKWHKPFLSGNSDDKSYEETLDYIRCMTLTQNVRPDIYFALTKENMDDKLVTIILMTYEAPAAALQEALDELATIPYIGKPVCLAVRD